MTLTLQLTVSHQLVLLLQGRIDTTYQLISHSFGFPGLTQKIAKDIYYAMASFNAEWRLSRIV